MVGRVRADPALEFGGVAGLLSGLVGERQGRAGAADPGVRGVLFADAAEQLARPLALAGRQVTAGQPGDGVGVAGFVVQDLVEQGAGGAVIIALERPVGALEGLLDRRRTGHAGQPRDEIVDLALGQRAGEAVDGFALGERVNRRDRLDAEGLGELRVFVDVDLDQPHLAARTLHRLFQRWAELLARAAPRRPEVDDDRRLLRGVEHVGLEVGGVAVLDEVRTARWRADDGFHEGAFRA